jgi:hypothetical protein
VKNADGILLPGDNFRLGPEHPYRLSWEGILSKNSEVALIPVTAAGGGFSDGPGSSPQKLSKKGFLGL